MAPPLLLSLSRSVDPLRLISLPRMAMAPPRSALWPLRVTLVRVSVPFWT